MADTFFPDRKASDLDEASELDGEEFWAGVQGGADIRIKTSQLTSHVAGIINRNLKAVLGSVQRAIDISSTNFTADVQRIWCGGYYSHNDAGPHWREKVVTAASHTLTSADGAHWRVCKGQKENVHMFGAVGDGQVGNGAAAGTDDQPAFQRNVQWGIDLNVPFVIRLLDFTYKIAGEIDFTNVTKSFGFVGEGPRRSIIAPTPFGAGKAVLKLTCNTVSSRVRRITITDLMIGRASSRAEDPIAIYAPYAQRLTIERVDLEGLGNTLIWTSSPFNCDWRDINADASGKQPMVKMISSTVRVSFTAGDTKVTASENLWSADDVGKTFYMQVTGKPGGVHCSTIDTYVSPTEIRVKHAPTRTCTGVYCSFDAMRGSIGYASQTLYLNAALAATDIGRFIYIGGGGYGSGGGGGNGTASGAHVARITDISSDGMTISIDTPTVNDAVDVRVWLTPTIYIGGSDVYDSELSSPANDIKIWNTKCEQYYGPAVLAHSGIFLFMNDLKCHGISAGVNNFAQSQMAFVGSNMSLTQLKHLEFEIGCHGLDSGNILMLGESALEVESVAVSGAQRGGYLVDMRNPNPSGFVQLGNVTYSQDVAEVFGHSSSQFSVGPVRCSSRGLMNRVYLTGSVNGPNREGDIKLLPTKGGSATIADDGLYAIKLGAGDGLVRLWTRNPSVFGAYYINTSLTPAISPYGAVGANAAVATGMPTGTTGTDSKFTSFVAAGYLYFENRTGAPIIINWDMDFAQTGSLWTPDDLGSDLLAFWDAEALGSLSLTAGAVDSWTDTKNGYVLSQSTAARKPTYGATSLSGRPGVTFDGADDYLEMAVSPLPIGATPMEAWAIWREDGPTSAISRIIWRYGGSTSPFYRSMLRNNASATQNLSVSAGDGISASASAVRDEDISGVHVLRGLFEAHRVRASVDGSNYTSASIAMNTPAGILRVGASTASTPANFAQGCLGGLLFTKQLTVEKGAYLLDFCASRPLIGY